MNDLCVCACVRACVCFCACVQDEAQYVCVVEIEGVQLNLTAAVEKTHSNTNTFTCSPHQVTHTLCANANRMLTSHLKTCDIDLSVCLYSFNLLSVSFSIQLLSICVEETDASMPHLTSDVRASPDSVAVSQSKGGIL